MTKKLVNILLILVLSVTILPIKQVGNMLFNNQWTEELSDHADHQVEKKSTPAKWALLKDSDLFNCSNQSLLLASSGHYAFSQSLPVNPCGEIHSPPPNLFR